MKSLRELIQKQKTKTRFQLNPRTSSSRSLKITGEKEHSDILPIPTRYENNNKSFRKVIIIIIITYKKKEKKNAKKNGLPRYHLLLALYYLKVMDGPSSSREILCILRGSVVFCNDILQTIVIPCG